MLYIITSVKDDLEGLIKTCASVDRFLLNGDYTHLVRWNISSPPDLEYFLKNTNRKFYFGDDLGLFDGMNKALDLIGDGYVLFLNSGDVIEENFDLSIFYNAPRNYMLPVTYRNFFGRVVNVKPKKTIKLGIPYCHQGLILKNVGIRFPTDRRFGGDYRFFLDSKLDWPLPLLKTGSVRYDTNGVSSINRLNSDLDTNAIVFSEFGFAWCMIHLARTYSKLFIKRIWIVFRKCLL